MKIKTGAILQHFLIVVFVIGLVCPIKPAFGQRNGWKSNQAQSDAGFWDSVYKTNHVLEVEIKLTREGWDAMHPSGKNVGPDSEAPRRRNMIMLNQKS